MSDEAESLPPKPPRRKTGPKPGTTRKRFDIVLPSKPVDEATAVQRQEILAAAAEIDPADVRARRRFIMDLGPRFERGYTTKALALQWGLSQNTLESDASYVWNVIKDRGDALDVGSWYQEIYAQLDKAVEDGALLRAALHRALDSGLELKSSDVKNLTESVGKLEDIQVKLRDLIGKALGLTATRQTFSVNIFDPKAKSPEAKEYQEARDKLLAIVLECFSLADAETEAKQLALLEERMGGEVDT